MRKEFFVRLKVYDNEMPELYARLECLPTGRIARRTALARVLHAGFAAIESKTEQVLKGEPHSSEIKVAPSVTAAVREHGVAKNREQRNERLASSARKAAVPAKSRGVAKTLQSDYPLDRQAEALLFLLNC